MYYIIIKNVSIAVHSEVNSICVYPWSWERKKLIEIKGSG